MIRGVPRSTVSAGTRVAREVGRSRKAGPRGWQAKSPAATSPANRAPSSLRVMPGGSAAAPHHITSAGSPHDIALAGSPPDMQQRGAEARGHDRHHHDQPAQPGAGLGRLRAQGARAGHPLGGDALAEIRARRQQRGGAVAQAPGAAPRSPLADWGRRRRARASYSSASRPGPPSGNGACCGHIPTAPLGEGHGPAPVGDLIRPRPWRPMAEDHIGHGEGLRQPREPP